MNLRLILLQPVRKRRPVMKYHSKSSSRFVSLKKKLPLLFVEHREKIKIRRLADSPARCVTYDLQKVYTNRTNRGPDQCLMLRCSRILRPIVPANSPRKSLEPYGRRIDEQPVLINLLLSMKNKVSAIVAVFASLSLFAGKSIVPVPVPETDTPNSAVLFHEINYEVRVSDDEARIVAEISAESSSKQEVSQVLFDGELALMPPRLPSALRIERSGNQYKLFVTKAGKYQFKVEVVGKVKRAEPWNQVSFTGPPAAIASVSAQASGNDVD